MTLMKGFGNCGEMWYPERLAIPLDQFLVELANDLHRAVIERADVPFCVRVPNCSSSTSAGLHWFTVCYSIKWTAPPVHVAVPVPVTGKPSAESGLEDIDQHLADEEEMENELMAEMMGGEF